MIQKIYKIGFGYSLLFSLLAGQTNLYSGINPFQSNLKTIMIFTFALLFLLLLYAIHLYVINGKLNKQKERLSKLSQEFKKKALEEEHRSETAELALRLISENTFDAIVMLNTEGEIIFWNSAAERLFGYSQERVLDSNFIETIMPEDKIDEMKVKYDFSEDLELKRKKQLIKTTAVQRDGTKIPIEIKVSNMYSSGIWNTICVIRKVSDSGTLEKELELAERHLQLSLQDEKVNMWEWNLQTNEMYFNTSTQEMLGYEKELYMRFDPWLKSVHPSDRTVLMDEIEKHKQNKINMVRVEYRVKTAYGTWNWIFTRGKIVEFDEDKNPLKFVGINSDINEQKIYETELETIQNDVLDKQIAN